MTSSAMDGQVATAAKHRPGGRGDAIAWVGFAVVLVTGLLFSLRTTLNGDVGYALGAMETAGAGGVSVWDVFVARPIAYRLFMYGLDGVRLALVGDGSMPVTSFVLRLEASLLVAGVAVLLHLGLRRHLATVPAALIAFGTGAALAIAPPWHFLQPDWTAALFGALAVGCALAPRRVWVGAVLGGFAAFLTIAVKLATAPICVVAILLIAVISFRQALRTVPVATAFTVLWYAATKHLLPWEWIWLHEQAILIPDSPFRHLPGWNEIHKLGRAVGDTAVLSPVIAAAPAAAVALIQRGSTPRLRWWVVAVLVAGASLAPAFGQAEYYAYHFAIVPVLAAAVWCAGFGLAERTRLPLITGLGALTVASAVLQRVPVQWRREHWQWVDLAYLLVAVVLAVWVWRAGAAPAGGRWARVTSPVAAATVLTASLALATLPGAPYSFSTYNDDIYWQATPPNPYAALGARLGPDTPVLYLTFANINFMLGNPTTCRYPSPQWLSRAAAWGRVRAYRSYADNLRCLTETKARYLIVDPLWMPIEQSAEPVRTAIEQRFDCSMAARLPDTGALLVCPRRPDAPA